MRAGKRTDHKKSGKMKKILLWSGGISLLLAIAFYFTMDLAVSYVLRSISEGNPTIESTESLPLSETDADGTPEADLNSNPESAVNQKDQDSSDQTQQDSITDADSAADKGTSDETGNTSAEDADKTANVDATPAGNTQTGTDTAAGDGASGYQAEISEEKAEAVKEDITLKEKAKVTSVILKKFDSSELVLFSQLMSGGLSIEEKKEAKKIFLAKLSEQEYNDLIAIAAKYGLSEGKKYDETEKP